MKTRYSRRRNSLLSGRPWLTPAAIACGVIVVLFLVFRILLPGALVAVATPLWQSGTALTAGVGNAGSFFTSKATLMRELDEMRTENAALYAKSATLEARARDLERLLGDRTEPVPGTLAGVLARPPVSPYDVLVLDAGSDDGIETGYRVEGPGGLPLGIIESVTGGSARALLYSTPAKETESWVGESRIPVTLIGEGSGAMSAVVARDAGIASGDLVYIAGPGAVALGTVTDVGNDPSSPRTRIDIRPLANPFSVTWVTVRP